ncbi:MAG: hypothetical protein OXE04_08465, partial [bacterium]|nr:hypothetical protein [bacterium]
MEFELLDEVVGQDLQAGEPVGGSPVGDGAVGGGSVAGGVVDGGGGVVWPGVVDVSGLSLLGLR